MRKFTSWNQAIGGSIVNQVEQAFNGLEEKGRRTGKSTGGTLYFIARVFAVAGTVRDEAQ